MRRPLLLPLAVAFAVVLAACASAAGPGWTYAPPTEAPPSQPAPSVAPSPEAPSDNGGGGVVVREVAKGIQFVTKQLSVPADTPFKIEFDNQDVGTPHNIEIKDASGQTVFKGEIFNGVEVVVYDIPALPAGTYPYICTVHPNMIGTLTVGG